VLRIARDAARAGRASEMVELLLEAGHGERWEPLCEALRAIGENDLDRLLRLAPEVRAPAEAIHGHLTAEAEPPIPALVAEGLLRSLRERLGRPLAPPTPAPPIQSAKEKRKRARTTRPRA
jgi:hypothetical protein